MSPERIHREIDFQFAQVALLRSLSVSVPCLVASVSFWRLRTDQNLWPIGYWICMFFLYGILFLAFWRQFKQYELIRRDAVAVGERHAGFLVPSLSQTFGPVETAVTIKGINFGNSPEKNKISFVHGAADTEVELTAMSWNPTWILVLVPTTAVKGKGKFVITLAGTADTAVEFAMTFTCPFYVT